MDTYENFKVETNSKNENVYCTLSLPYRVKIEYVNRFSDNPKTTIKTFLNCLNGKPSSWSVLHGDIKVAPTNIITTKGNEPYITELRLTRHWDSKKYGFEFTIGNRYYNVISINGDNPFKYASHLVGMLDIEIE